MIPKRLRYRSLLKWRCYSGLQQRASSGSGCSSFLYSPYIRLFPASGFRSAESAVSGGGKLRCSRLC